MFEKEAEEYAGNREVCDLLDAISEDLQNYDYGTVAHYNIDPLVEECFKDGAEFGYNRGYHEAEEHYLNVINSQHKLVDESKKKDFRKCMECTNGTYQSGFKDGFNKANEWHYVKDGDYPKDDKQYLVLFFYNYKGKKEMSFGVRDNLHSDFEIKRCYTEQIIAWKEIVPPKEIKEK